MKRNKLLLPLCFCATLCMALGVAACGKDAVAKGAHAGNILREISAIAGGKGGGRPDSAMSGGRDLTKIADALAAAETVLSGMIK